jgi:cysteine desulfuration protein SufE
MENLPLRLQLLLDEMRDLSDREERADFLIELASRFQGVPAEVCSRPYPEAHRVAGCESEAFVFAVPVNRDSVRFYFAVENPQGISAKALAVILDEGLSGAPLREIESVPEHIVHELFGSTVSMGKGQGLMGMIRSAKVAARESMQPELRFSPH